MNQHIISGNLPELGLSSKPTGALNWQLEQRENIQEVDLVDDDVVDDDEVDEN